MGFSRARRCVLTFTVVDKSLIIGAKKDYAAFYDTPYGIAWNKGKQGSAPVPKTCAQFWDTKSFPGKRSLRGRADFVLEIALVADGVDPAK